MLSSGVTAPHLQKQPCITQVSEFSYEKHIQSHFSQLTHCSMFSISYFLSADLYKYGHFRFLFSITEIP